MAPTQSTCPALNTRSVARRNGVFLRSLDTGVRKYYQCIICDKKNGSRAALSRHFKSHTTRPEELSPFTRPSCWDENSATYPPSKQHIDDLIVDDNIFDTLPSAKQKAINTNIEDAMAGVKNKKQLRQKEDQQRLRLLHWWFRANEAPTTQADQLVPNPDQAARSASAESSFFDYDFDRSLNGSVIADFELASTRPLTSLPLLWCMSNTFTHLVKTFGEDLLSAITLKRAVEEFLKEIGTSQDFPNRLNSRFDGNITRKYDGIDHSDEKDKCAALVSNGKRFRKDRAFIWGLLEEAVREYFNDYEHDELPVGLGARHSSEEVKVVVRATRAFAMVLRDAETSAYIKKYWTGKI